MTIASSQRQAPSTPRAKSTPGRSTSPVKRASAPSRGEGSTTPARISIKDQIAALRASQGTPDAKGSSSSVGTTPRNRGGSSTPLFAKPPSMAEVVRKAGQTGKLLLQPSSPPLKHLPPQLYSTLLGIPINELSRPPPTRNVLAKDHNTTPVKGMGSLSLVDDDEPEDPFKTEEEDWGKPFTLGGTDLSVLKVMNQELEDVEMELGLFGGLKVVDFRHNNLSKLPESFANLSILTSLNLSHNPLIEIPAILTHLPSLIDLDLSHCGITSLSFIIPTLSPASDDFFSFGQSTLPPTEPLPKLKTLLLNDNELTSSSLPPAGSWPKNIIRLDLSRNPLLPFGQGGEFSLSPAVTSITQLRKLSIRNCNCSSLSSKGRASLRNIIDVDMGGNSLLSSCVEDLTTGWAQDVTLSSIDKSFETHSGINIVLDAHLLPQAAEPMSRGSSRMSNRSLFVDEDGNDNGGDLGRDQWGLPILPAVGKNKQQQPEAPLAIERPKQLIDDFDFGLPMSEHEARMARNRAAAAENRAAAQATSMSRNTSATGSARNASPVMGGSDFFSTTTTSADNDSSNIYSSLCISKTQTFKTVSSSVVPDSKLDLSILAESSWAVNDMKYFSLQGRAIRSIIFSPSITFPKVESISITGTPIRLSLRDVLNTFPNATTVDLSETSLSSIEGISKLGKSVKKYALRACGIKDIGELEDVARKTRDGERWECTSLDLCDNQIEKLDSVLGYLPLSEFLVDRNLFRTPHRRVYEKGTASLLQWLKERIIE